MTRRNSQFPGVLPELDLVEADEQITHEDATLDIENPDLEEGLNYFREDPNFLQNEEKYAEIRRELLGESDSDSSDDADDELGDEEEDEEDEEEAAKKLEIQDQTEAELVAVRRTIYLTIMSSLDFEECAHKLLQNTLKPGIEQEFCTMCIECCSQERTFMRFYGLLAQRFCLLDRAYQEIFDRMFREQYATIHRYETNKVRRKRASCIGGV